MKFKVSQLALIAVAAMGLTLAGCEKKAPKIQVVDFRANPAAVEAGNGAVYLTLDNQGKADDQLVGATSPVAEVVELHETTITDGVMSMNKVESFNVPAGGKVELTPGGKHLMLIGLKSALADGQSVDLNLTFKTSGQVSLSVPVKAAEMAAMDHAAAPASDASSEAAPEQLAH
ncbi:MAG: hypothetical protein A2600_12780 [Candidatus Lambdaproteobacteria bacterium RIFOXYD1_FULL_56_27]|uniref:Copper chaperone PCu(A)C n=1 Tax=Candidatus Lambdaproteobacteria bacterium RIFOXYD2_FULL_56_26 TaxID=1817773 RepID=A0A1F6H2B5_9PROT|nr:MAG: hypothetical protein A2426_00240 [Candidatus Lambdaproteobacteria bacterium RIFOXYC1_FULL_56_13]OGH04505.1 MAG: hypothetical protein A2557_02100 [Candidatus Lambdaproteobacteria bacterium RIFOXYD2_FULL_56_26]OGH08337.1 MAG: hypothetical protein A2600_12780 [Candidatus Lambdaproteobacteria bacterium RIFOXYD1_FULL_56_27]